MALEEKTNNKTKEKKKPISMMTLSEIRNEIENIKFDLSGIEDKNIKHMLKWLNMPTDKFTKLFKEKGYTGIMEYSGAIHDGAIVIPNGLEKFKTLYYIINLRIEEVNRIEYAEKQRLKSYENDAQTSGKAQSGVLGQNTPQKPSEAKSELDMITW